MRYYAHIRQDEDTGETLYQTVADHLSGTAALCCEFAKAFGAEADGEFAGSVHDIGKFTEEFQNRLLRNGAIVDHATAGAVFCAKNDLPFCAVCVSGHHGGLQDFGNKRTDKAGEPTFIGRLKKGIEKKYLEFCDTSGFVLPGAFASAAPQDKLRLSFWTRMLYSCLVDADYLDTERFMRGQTGRDGYDDIHTLLDRLDAYIQPWQNPKTALNRLRCAILQSCAEAGCRDKGIYTLTVPTGGGKTVASLAFALRHAAHHEMKRIIYVIPYTSIIDQNAFLFRKILGDGNVLEHHSGVQYELSEDASPEEIRRALAVENWDMPVIVTTAVQFFESMYANRSSKCRKLHNLADSVVIFDEAQMLPIEHLKPCVAAMAALVEQFHSTVLLCTATQPSLNDLFNRYAPSHTISELCPQTEDLYEKFRRVCFRQIGKKADDALAEQLRKHSQVLCIVNSRKAAQSIFALLPEENRYHLSTLMIPAQRQSLLKEIRERLSKNLPCRVVSTSLIEAGVDIDFPNVYRELSGLDSIMQAAGRCNREGLRTAEESVVTIFERTEPAPALFRIAIGATKEALSGDHEVDDPETMRRYFRSLRSLNGNGALDRHEVIRAFESGIYGCELPFSTVADKFHLIDRSTYTIYVPYEEGAELISRLRDGECSKSLYRKLGRYAVAVYERHFQTLDAAGVLLTARDIPSLDAYSAILTDLSVYDEQMGLSLEPETGKAEFI